ncbi:hypothetical protein [Streptomyces sp. NPDC088360]|uniref:hypothetical protein n=1 Tax=Streptomyces sp. NPDC088360 TaxID=3154515 RepID=UPI00344D444B
MDRRNFLTTSAYSVAAAALPLGSAVDLASRIQTGARTGAVVGNDVAPLCRGRFRTGEVRQQMLSAASRGVLLIGWKAYDTGNQALAQRYYLQAFALAAEGGLIGQDGFIMTPPRNSTHAPLSSWPTPDVAPATPGHNGSRNPPGEGIVVWCRRRPSSGSALSSALSPRRSPERLGGGHGRYPSK